MLPINTIINGDCLEKLKELEENSVDSIVTDPPYELGFMGKSWDNTGIANNKEMWAECLRVLKPGGHLLAFSGTRTYHRMASAIEDAGFEVRDMIEWVYSTGFPKSLNVYKHLQKKCKCGNMEVYENRIKQMGKDSEAETEYFLRFMQEADLSQTISPEKKQGKVLQSGLSEQSSHRTVQGEEPEESSKGREERVLERGNNTKKTEGELQGSYLSEMPERVFSDGEERRIYNATQAGDGSAPKQTINENGSSASQGPQSEQQQYREPCAFCKQWGTQAIRTLGVGTATKPAHEPICLARKPLEEKTVAKNVLKYGTGGINIDESRVGKTGARTNSNGKRSMYGGNSLLESKTHNDTTTEHNYGRFPANLIHDNSEEVRECFPETKTGKAVRSNSGGKTFGGENTKPVMEDLGYDDNGGNASRFFKSIIYQAKSSKSERNKGLDKLVLVDIIHILSNNTNICEKSLTQEVRLAKLLVSMEASQLEVTAESGTQQKSVTKWSTELFGKSLTEKYQKDFQSIILTKTQSITTSQIYKWLVFLLTNEYTADVSLEMENGGNPVVSAENSNTLIITISEKMALALGVKDVQSPVRLKISVSEGKSGHPTVKPIALMEYLIKMVTPKGGTVLDPFAGSGSTLVAAKQNGFQYVGIEMTPEYIPIIEARLKGVPATLF